MTVAILIALLGFVYGTTMKGLALEWASSPDSSYGAILLVVAGAIAWRRRAALRAAVKRDGTHLFGFLLLAFGLFLYLIGYFGADVFVTRVSLVVVLAGLTAYLGGNAAARVLAPPLCFLLLAIPLPALLVNAITLPLQLVASRLAEGMLSVGGVPVFRDGNILELRSTSLQVAEACSGLRSLISLSAIACLVAWATESTVVRRALVVSAAVPIAIVLNAIRIAATGVACETWGPHMARGGWHEFTGWLTFVAAILALVQFQRLLPGAHRRTRTLAPEMVSA